jgi:hypothetical protein
MNGMEHESIRSAGLFRWISTNQAHIGSDRWIRADFHLHTRRDREFQDTGSDQDFARRYVAALKSAGIRVGVITNHNKFDFVKLNTELQKAKLALDEITKSRVRSSSLRDELLRELKRLSDLWHEEFKGIEAELSGEQYT